jgi:hypothetical protein
MHNAYKVDISKTTTLSHTCFFLFHDHCLWSSTFFCQSGDIFWLTGVNVHNPLVQLAKFYFACPSMSQVYRKGVHKTIKKYHKHSKRERETSEEPDTNIILKTSWLCSLKGTNVKPQRKLARCQWILFKLCVSQDYSVA